MLVAEMNRSDTASHSVQKSLKDHIKWLEKRVEQIDKELKKKLHQTELWTCQDDILQSVPRVGEVLSVTLLGLLPELAYLSRQQLAALVGVAPMTQESGKWKGKARIQGGRASIRSVLIHGCNGCHSLQSCNQGFLSKIDRQRKTTQSRNYRLFKKIVDHPEYYDS